MEIWKTILTGKAVCLYFSRWRNGFLFRRFDLRGPPAFKLETKQQKPQEEEVPIRAMAALKISRKHCPWRHHSNDLLTWRQIKTLLIKLKIWSLNKDCLRVLNTFSWQCSIFWLVPPPTRARTNTQPPSITGGLMDGERTNHFN